MAEDLTLFHRADQKARAGACDVASQPVQNAKTGAPAGFIGAAWGSHKPGACLHYKTTTPGQVDQVLLDWGLVRTREGG